MRRRAFWLPVLLAVAAYLVLPLPGLSAPLSKRIETAQKKVRGKKYKESVHSEAIAGYNTRIDRLQGEIRGLARRQSSIQARLDSKRAELARLRERLERARERLARLKLELAKSERALAARLVELYKADEPDALTVVLEADGFADLLERTEFLELVSKQDQRIVRRVRELKAEAARLARELASLERRTEAAATAIQARRDELRAAKDRSERARGELQETRDGRQVALSRVRSSRVRLEGDLREFEAEQARVQAALRVSQSSQGSAGGGSSGSGGEAPSAGPIKRGSGQLIWPVSGPVVSPFGPRWGRLHAGIDIASPAGTPIRAADSGRVALAGVMGGYGNYTCIQHGGSLSTCYAHQSSIGVSQGASVSQGQVIGSVGCTGHCFGDHLHFETRVSGMPANPFGYL